MIMYCSSQTKEKLVVNKKYFEELMSLFKKEKYIELKVMKFQNSQDNLKDYQ